MKSSPVLWSSPRAAHPLAITGNLRLRVAFPWKRESTPPTAVPRECPTQPTLPASFIHIPSSCSRRQVDRLAHGPPQPTHLHNEFLLHFLLCRNTFLPCRKQFSNYDKCQPVMLCQMRVFVTPFITFASRLVIIFSHNVSYIAVLIQPSIKWASYERKKNPMRYCTAIARYFLRAKKKTAIDGDDDGCCVEGNSEDTKRWSGANESPFSLTWYG